jgi:hypothetical protein
MASHLPKKAVDFLIIANSKRALFDTACAINQVSITAGATLAVVGYPVQSWAFPFSTFEGEAQDEEDFDCNSSGTRSRGVCTAVRESDGEQRGQPKRSERNGELGTGW